MEPTSTTAKIRGAATENFILRGAVFRSAPVDVEKLHIGQDEKSFSSPISRPGAASWTTQAVALDTRPRAQVPLAIGSVKR